MAVGYSFEPGSTFKLVSFMALIEKHKINLNDSLFFKHNYIVFHKRKITDSHFYKNGRFTVREAFEHSSNIGTSRMTYDAFHNNPAEYIDFIYSTGLNKKTGIEIKGEPKPFIKHPAKNKKSWSALSLPWMSYGYELTLTPLQILTFYNAVANNGTMVKPTLVTEIQQDGKTLQKFDTKILNPQIASPNTIKKAQSLLEGVVLRGTGRKLKNDNYAIAGKTGTAQIAEGGKNRHRYNATFVGYFPADNPKFSIIVVVNNPTKNGYFGATVAGPVFKEVADYIYANSLSLENKFLADTASPKIPPARFPVWFDDAFEINSFLNYKMTEYSDKSNWVIPEKINKTITYSPVKIDKGIMPDVKGMSAKDAVYILSGLGLQASLNGRGKVVAQSINPGISVKPGNKVFLRLGTW